MIRFTIQKYPDRADRRSGKSRALAIEQAKKLKPDVIVMNIVMPIMNGFEAAREIKKHVPQSSIRF